MPEGRSQCYRQTIAGKESELMVRDHMKHTYSWASNVIDITKSVYIYIDILCVCMWIYIRVCICICICMHVCIFCIHAWMYYKNIYIYLLGRVKEGKVAQQNLYTTKNIYIYIYILCSAPAGCCWDPVRKGELQLPPLVCYQAVIWWAGE